MRKTNYIILVTTMVSPIWGHGDMSPLFIFPSAFAQFVAFPLSLLLIRKLVRSFKTTESTPALAGFILPYLIFNGIYLLIYFQTIRRAEDLFGIFLLILSLVPILLTLLFLILSKTSVAGKLIGFLLYLILFVLGYILGIVTFLSFA